MKLTELHTIKFPSLHTHLELFTETVLAATYPPAGLMAVSGNLSRFKPTPGEIQGDYLINQPRQPSVNLFTSLLSVLALCSSSILTTAFAADFINITPPAPGGGTYVQTVYVNGSTVYAPTDTGLAISTDGGYTYTNRTAANGLGGGTIAGIYVSGSTVYAATGVVCPFPPMAVTPSPRELMLTAAWQVIGYLTFMLMVQRFIPQAMVGCRFLPMVVILLPTKAMPTAAWELLGVQSMAFMPAV